MRRPAESEFCMFSLNGSYSCDVCRRDRDALIYALFYVMVSYLYLVSSCDHHGECCDNVCHSFWVVVII